MNQLFTVDFKNKQLIESQCIPKRETWKCDCCGKSFTNIEGGDNIRRVELEKKVYLPSGKSAGDVIFKICEKCCTQLGDVFKEEL
jgi:hypothetical protein